MRTALGLPDRYVVGTIHRQANVDDDASARAVFGALADVAREVALVLPLHPRGRRAIERLGLDLPPELRVVEPLGYVEFLSLLRSAALVITDSGGVQEETTILGVPCLTMRPNTERPITIEQGTNVLVSPHELLGAVRHRLAAAKAEPMAAPALWDGHAGERIAAVIEARLA
jgi:UDP-N-acetylglucosamine 2-epimerase (non-hydrolysing)